MRRIKKRNICLSYCHFEHYLFPYIFVKCRLLTRRGHIIVKMNFGCCIIVSFMPFGCDMTVKSVFICVETFMGKCFWFEWKLESVMEYCKDLNIKWNITKEESSLVPFFTQKRLFCSIFHSQCCLKRVFNSKLVSFSSNSHLKAFALFHFPLLMLLSVAFSSKFNTKGLL